MGKTSNTQKPVRQSTVFILLSSGTLVTLDEYKKLVAEKQ